MEIVIECSDIRTIEQFHDRLADQLQFPSFYGGNWDAFWDTITGLVEMPKRLTFKNYSHFKDSFPRDNEILEKSLEDMTKMYPDVNCKVLYS